MKRDLLPDASIAHGPAGWQARLALEYRRQGERTLLAARRHEGPLRVQKMLYPEGPEVCHTLLLHPPGGIAAGDSLDISIDCGPATQVLLSTPGAGKWYRSEGAAATQRVRLQVGVGATLEWLPQETIFFDASRAQLDMQVELDAGAGFIGWDILCLGRSASGERFDRGLIRSTIRIRREGRLLWQERTRLAGADALLRAPTGLNGATVCATLWLASPALDASLLAALRDVVPGAGEAGVTCLPGLLLARHIGHDSETARHYLAQLWSVARPLLNRRDAVAPRIWNT